MKENKTKLNDASVMDFLNSVENEKRKADSLAVLKMMKRLTKEEPKMWGTALVGFGSYHYKYESGREGDFFITGFSPRKQSLTLYIMNGFQRYEELMSQLGKFKTGKSCLYINRLEDIDQNVLEKLIVESVNYMKQKYH
jgi:hypothetical protein